MGAIGPDSATDHVTGADGFKELSQAHGRAVLRDEEESIFDLVVRGHEMDGREGLTLMELIRLVSTAPQDGSKGRGRTYV